MKKVVKKSLAKAGLGKVVKAVGKAVTKTGKAINPDKGYNPYRKATPVKDVAKGAAVLGAYGAGAYGYLTNEQAKANKAKVEANKTKVEANKAKVAANAAKYEKNGGATKSTYKKGGAVKVTAKKPMMKSGGAKRTLRKYQGDGPEGSEVGPGGGSARPSFADAYKANITVGIRPSKARKIAMVESGVKEQKKRIDPNTIINAIGNTAGAVGSVANALKKPAAGPTTSGPAVNPGSTSINNQNPGMEFEKRGGAIKKKGGTMAKMGCAKCGKMMKKGGVKKMKAGGSTDVNISKPGAGFAKPQRGGDDQKYFIYGMPTAGIGETDGKNGKMKKGGAVKKMAKGGSTFGMLSVKAGVDNNPNATAADRIAGATKKAKFGATVKVQRSPKAGKVRSAGDQGYASVGQREPGRVIKKILSKKAQGGPIIDKLKAKLAERKVTKTIKKSVKSSGKIVK